MSPIGSHYMTLCMEYVNFSDSIQVVSGGSDSKAAGAPLNVRDRRKSLLKKIMNTSSLFQKIWINCHTLRDDGVGYGNFKIKRIPAEWVSRVAVKKPRGIKAKGAL